MGNEWGLFGVVVVLAALALAVAWVLLPVALIGTKPLLRQIIDQQRETNAHLTALHDSARELREDLRRDAASRT